MEVIDEVVDKTTVKKKKVIIGLPGNKFSSRFLVSWTSALNTLWENGKYDIVISPGVSSFVSFARMQTLGLNNLRGIDQKPFDGMDFDIFITIDSDIIFLPQNLLELIEATEQHSVVSGVYRMTDLKSMAVVSEWDINYFKKEGNFKYLTHEDLDNWKKNNENEIIRFDQLNIDLGSLVTTTIKATKIQETSTLKLINCFIIKNNIDKYCNKNFKREILSNLNRRIITPFYIPVLSLICSLLLIKSEKIYFNKISVFIYSFIILLFTELAVRYTGVSNFTFYLFIILPFMLLIFFYLFLSLKFSSELNKYE